MSTVILILLIIISLLFAAEMRHSLRRSAESYRLIQAYRDDLQNPKLITEIYAYCQQDYKLRRIMKKHQVTEADIRSIYQKLLTWGNFHKGHRFVPITSFFYACTLKYLVTHKDGDAKALTMRCMNFLHI